MKFFKDLFRNFFSENELKPQRFSFTAAAFGILVPLFRKDLKWFSLYFFIIFFLMILGVLGIGTDFLILLLLLWNSVFSCYYNTWSQKDDFWMDDRYTRSSEKKRKKREEESSSFVFFTPFKRKTDMLLKRFIAFRKVPPNRKDFHLKNIIIIFSLTIFYYLLSAMFLEGSLKDITGPSRGKKSPALYISKETEEYYSFLSKEIHYLYKLEKKRGPVLSEGENRYSRSLYDRDLRFIEKRLSYQKEYSYPEGFEDLHRDLEDIYTTYRKFLNHQYLYLSSDSKRDRTLAVNYRHRFFQLEERLLSELEEKLHAE